MSSGSGTASDAVGWPAAKFSGPDTSVKSAPAVALPELRTTSTLTAPAVDPTRSTNSDTSPAPSVPNAKSPLKRNPGSSAAVRIDPSAGTPLGSPTAMNCSSANPTAKRTAVTPDDFALQVMPSGEVRMVPFSPTARALPLPLPAPRSHSIVPEVCSVHVNPEGEVSIVPS